MAPRKTNLDLVKECDNFPYPSISPKEYESLMATFYHFKYISFPSLVLGYIPEWVVQKMGWTEDFKVSHADRTVTLTATHDPDAAMAKLGNLEREKGTFQLLSGWRNELYPVYGPDRQVLFSMERSASPLFGIVSFGVHLTGYVRQEDGSVKIWAPRRSMTKSTYPGMWDNTVAGGISTGEDPFEGIVREAQEEASLPQALVRKHAKPVGIVSYFHVRDSRAGGESGLCQPECQYIYDIELPADVIPVPDDNEAEDFQLLGLDELKEAMATGRFKPNCAAVLVDFFIRHGILRHDNEKDYIEIVSRLHRLLEFPMA